MKVFYALAPPKSDGQHFYGMTAQRICLGGWQSAFLYSDATAADKELQRLLTAKRVPTSTEVVKIELTVKRRSRKHR